MAASILCHCGNQFLPKKNKANKYCSMQCYRAAQRAGVYKRGHGPDFPRSPCADCGKTVARIPSRRRDGTVAENVFCDRECYDRHRARIRALRSAECAGCQSAFIPDTDSRRYCSEACWKSDKKAQPKSCINCKCVFTPVKFVAATGRYISHSAGRTCSAQCGNQWIRNNPERKRKISKAFSGASHPNWQGGKSLLNNVSGRGGNWQRQRAAALKRDKYRCVDCGISQAESKQRYGRGLDVDHVVPFHNFGSAIAANVLSNLQCRCASCHRVAEAKRGMVQMMLPLQDSRSRSHNGRTYGERHNTAKLRESQVLQIRRMADDGAAMACIARQFDVSASAVWAIVRGRTWRRLPLGSTAGDRTIGRNQYS